MRDKRDLLVWELKLIAGGTAFGVLAWLASRNLAISVIAGGFFPVYGLFVLRQAWRIAGLDRTKGKFTGGVPEALFGMENKVPKLLGASLEIDGDLKKIEALLTDLEYATLYSDDAPKVPLNRFAMLRLNDGAYICLNGDEKDSAYGALEIWRHGLDGPCVWEASLTGTPEESAGLIDNLYRKAASKP